MLSGKYVIIVPSRVLVYMLFHRSKLETSKKDKDGRRKKSQLLEMTVTAKSNVVEFVPPYLIPHYAATNEDINGEFHYLCHFHIFFFFFYF